MGRAPSIEDPRIQALRDREPEIGEAGLVCLEAWRTLDNSRQSMAVSIGTSSTAITSGSIHWIPIRDWCEWKGLDRDETAIVTFVLRRLDADRAKREGARLQELARRK